MAKKNAAVVPVTRGIALGQTAMAEVVEPEVSVQLSKGFRLTINGLQVQGQPTFAEACTVGETLRVAERAGGFALGDFILYLEERFKEEAAQYIDSENFNLKTVATYRWLAENVRPSVRRMDRLGIKHHLMVATLSPAKQKMWLDRAANDEGDEPWTAAELAAAMRDDGDALPSWWLLVGAKDKGDMLALQESLEAQGRSTKAVTRRSRKAKES